MSSRPSVAPKVTVTPLFPQRRFTQPLKGSYECPTCNTVLQIQTCDDEKRGYLSGCKYVQCTHENTRYEEWPKKFQWVTEWYWATSEDDDDQEPAASKFLDPDNIAVYHLGECAFGGCHLTKLHRDCKRRFCNFHCRATGNCSVACHHPDGTTSASPPTPSIPATPATPATPSVPSSPSKPPTSSTLSTLSTLSTPSTPSSPSKPPTSSIRSTHPTPSAPQSVGPHAQSLRKKRKQEPQVKSIKRRHLEVIDLTLPGSSRDDPIDLDA
ncbi:hypothetical protein LXA43DRAFT_1102036 [Ganoderma leucocontextum]|nr:hypothetical protein LXA43DRAFT_1102036 [Ganoderma leucocontextum]